MSPDPPDFRTAARAPLSEPPAERSAPAFPLIREHRKELARWFATSWATGVPLPLPLAAVQSERWRVPAGAVLWVCENPSVLAAAAGTGATVVCVEGRPSVAASLLLSSLVEGGGKLRYHGDFGAGGISIANAVIWRDRGGAVAVWRGGPPPGLGAGPGVGDLTPAIARRRARGGVGCRPRLFGARLGGRGRGGVRHRPAPRRYAFRLTPRLTKRYRYDTVDRWR